MRRLIIEYKLHLVALALGLAVLIGFLQFWQRPNPMSQMPMIEVFHPQEEPPPEPTQPPTPILSTFIEVVDACGPYFSGEGCVNARSGPGTDYPSVAQLRDGVVLKVSPEAVERDGHTWYKVVFDEWVRYPERKKSMYVAADYVRVFEDIGSVDQTEPYTGSKRILVDRSDQKLYAYEGETLFMEQDISTGHDLTPTPRGTFKIFRKTPSRYMQGPVPGISEDEYDLPGVPWDLYFTKQGGALHGAYWHDNFGQQWSHGCVNLPIDKARELYEWAELGVPVTVRD